MQVLSITSKFLCGISMSHFPCTGNAKTHSLCKTHTVCLALHVQPHHACCAWPMPVSDSPRVIQGMSAWHCRWVCQWPVHTFHDKNDNNDKVSTNLCQSLSWATFQVPCNSCHLCHSTKGNRYTSPRYEHRQWLHPQMGMSVTLWIAPNDNW